MSTAFSINMTGAQQVPPIVSSATGRGFAVFDSVANTLRYQINFFGFDWGAYLGFAAQTPGNTLDDINGAHFHNGVAGANAGVVLAWSEWDTNDFGYTIEADGSVTIRGRWDSADLNSITAPVIGSGFIAALGAAVQGTDVGLYANVHTVANGGGEIRGQLIGNATDASEAVTGTSGKDTLFGLGGNDILNGLDGDDTLVGGTHLPGSFNQLNGGIGLDYADFSDETGAVFVDLRAGAGHIDAGGGLALNDVMTSIEGVIGGSAADTLIGTDADANVLNGGAGTDVLFGLGGDDTFIGGGKGPGGANQLWGGAGNDTASYAAETFSVIASLTGFWAYIGAAEQANLHDTYNSIENLIGGSGADVLFGDVFANVLEGRAGADQLYGFAGADTFVYRAYGDSNVVTGYDTIADFVAGTDKIDLRAYGTDSSHVVITSDGVSTKLWVEQSPGTFNGATDLAVALIGGNALTVADILF